MVGMYGQSFWSGSLNAQLLFQERSEFSTFLKDHILDSVVMLTNLILGTIVGLISIPLVEADDTLESANTPFGIPPLFPKHAIPFFVSFLNHYFALRGELQYGDL